MSAERVLIFYQGDGPDDGDIRQIVEVVERQAGNDLDGARFMAFPAAPTEMDTEMLAQAMVHRLEGEGEITPGSLFRMSTHRVETTSGLRFVSVVWPDVWPNEENAWVRHLIPQHLARAESAGTGLTQRPGWATLGGEAALSFVARAKDGAGKRFDNVHVVVSSFHESQPRRIRKLMPGGYLKWVDNVFDRAGAQLGTIDVAHWLVCLHISFRQHEPDYRHAVHLAYLPADRSKTPLLPWELLSRAEKRQGTRLA